MCFGRSSIPTAHGLIVIFHMKQTLSLSSLVICTCQHLLFASNAKKMIVSPCDSMNSEIFGMGLVLRTVTALPFLLYTQNRSIPSFLAKEKFCNSLSVWAGCTTSSSNILATPCFSSLCASGPVRYAGGINWLCNHRWLLESLMSNHKSFQRAVSHGFESG